MKSKPRDILQHFPEKADDLLMLMSQNPDFQDLCDDYDICAQALRYWIKSPAPEAKERIAEYRTIALELEEEIVQQLKSQKPPEHLGSTLKDEKEQA